MSETPFRQEIATNTEASVNTGPVFNGGSFTIDFLTTGTQGLRVQTVESLRRHQAGTPLPFAPRINAQRDREKKEFRVGPGFKVKVGVREPVLEANTLKIKIKPVTFPTYKAISSSGESQEAQEISDLTGNAAILLTTEPDGSHNLVVQHRSANNAIYGETVGASFAGMFDGHLDKTKRENRGKLLPINDETIKANAVEEMNQEIGLSSSDLTSLRILGFAKDNVKIHHEFLLFATTNLSAKDIEKKAEESAKTKHKGEFDFEEKFFVIKGTPDSIEKLLTEVKCPLPPTHSAAFVAFGYHMILEQKGKTQADLWKQKLEKGVAANYASIDSMVRDFYIKNPTKVKDQPEGKNPRKTTGYDPAYIPQDQGLPPVPDELKRVGLLLQ